MSVHASTQSRPARAHRGRARAVIAAVAAAAIVPGLLIATASPAAAGDEKPRNGTCEGLDSGRQVIRSKVETVLVSAPKGRLIAAYCVGSAGYKGESGAPSYVRLEKPLSELVLSHPEGGRLTQYSLVYVDADEAEEPVEPGGPFEPTPVESEDFDWNWTYADPTCSALTVAYPRDLPTDQANDINVRLKTDQGPLQLNFHNNDAMWSGTTSFTFAQHPLWPSDVKEYTVTWVQVAGTNYHWQGDVDCRVGDGRDPAAMYPREVSEVRGYRSGAVKVKKGKAVKADDIRVDGEGLDGTVLERYDEKQGWQVVSTVRTDRDGDGTVAYPKLKAKGTYQFRVTTQQSEAVTGAVTDVLVASVA